MTRKRPYTKTDSPHEWARKKILDLEEKVTALTTKVAEQSSILEAILEALLASRLGGVSQVAEETDASKERCVGEVEKSPAGSFADFQKDNWDTHAFRWSVRLGGE